MTHSALPALFGWSVSGSSDTEAIEPNALGQLTFGTPDEYARWSSGQAAGTHAVIAGGLRRHLASRSAAVFAEREWRPAFGAAVRTGVRADYQSRNGILLSPRLSLMLPWGWARLNSAAGVFRENWSNSVLLQAQRFRPGNAHVLMGDAVGEGFGPAGPRRLHSSLDPELAPACPDGAQRPRGRPRYHRHWHRAHMDPRRRTAGVAASSDQ